MLENYIHGLVDTLQTHPNCGLALAFFIAFLESLAVIGTIVPGSITMTAVGALVGARVLPASWTFLIVVAGALCGDLLSYWVGRHYDQRLTKMWPFTTHPQWIKSGEQFFAKHGGKSVIIGRFFGPVRSFVPLIAGFLHMHPLYFILAVIPSAILWAIVYLVPGVLLGALSVELPPSLATKFVIYLFLGLIAIWLMAWIVKLIIQKLWGIFDQSISKLWQKMLANKRWHFITTPLADPREPDLHKQLLLLFAAIISFLLTLIVLWNITHHGILTAFNEPVHALLQSIRTPFADKILTPFTLLSDRKCILSFAMLILCWLSWKRQWRAAVHWLLLMVLVIGSALAIKWGYYSPRPQPDLPSNSTSSLPSGHTIFSLAFFGFLSVLIGHDLPREKKHLCYKIALSLILLAAFSRIYLGPHWLTDIVASFLLGLTCLLVVIISYRRQHSIPISPHQLSVAAIAILLIIWPSYSVWRYSGTIKFHEQHASTVHLTQADWWQQSNELVPLLRSNRLGNPAHPLNVEWHGALSDIQQHLEQQGWESHSPSLDLTGFLERLSLQDPDRRLPLLTQLFHNRPPALLMTKLNTKNHYDFVLYLWQSDIELINNKTPLWVGVIEKYENPHTNLFHTHSKEKITLFTDVLPTLLSDTRTLKTTTITLPLAKRANFTSEWEWQGEILQIEE
jgi:membrane protein DedA with SNARE-associated domain/membrane-associated phospholipid phosphatase